MDEPKDKGGFVGGLLYVKTGMNGTDESTIDQYVKEDPKDVHSIPKLLAKLWISTATTYLLHFLQVAHSIS